MPSEFELPPEEVKDPMRKWWVLAVLLFALFAVALFAIGRPEASRSRVRVRHILIAYDATDPGDRAAALELAHNLRDRLLAGESFSRLAREYSSDPQSAERGGDLGWAERGTYAPAFEDYVWSAPIGELSEVVRTSFGFHIIMVEDREMSPGDRYEEQLERKADELLETGLPRDGGAAE